MFIDSRVYKKGNQYREYHYVYQIEDLEKGEKLELFKDHPKYWDGAAENYKSYLHRGKFKNVKPEYRLNVKNSLLRTVIKMYLKMMMRDLLMGYKVKLAGYKIFFHVTNRNPKSRFFDIKKLYNYIPFITLPKSITGGRVSGMYYFFFTKRFQKLLDKEIKNGRRYKQTDYEQFNVHKPLRYIKKTNEASPK